VKNCRRREREREGEGEGKREKDLKSEIDLYILICTYK
jgi:hypothetical protein